MGGGELGKRRKHPRDGWGQGGPTAFLRNGVFGDARLPGQAANWVCPRRVMGHVEHLLVCPLFPGLHSAAFYPGRWDEIPNAATLPLVFAGSRC